VGILIWFIRKIPPRKTLPKESPPATPAKSASPASEAVPAGHVAHVAQASNVGRDTCKMATSGPGGQGDLFLTNSSAFMPLAAPVVGLNPIGQGGELASPQTMCGSVVNPAQVALLNSADLNIDPAIQAQWAVNYEIPAQTNTTAERSGAYWAKNWEFMGPLPPFSPPGQPGPQDPQLAYASAVTAALDSQGEKFSPGTGPGTGGSDVTATYMNELQQIPGSHFETFAASWDSSKTPMVVERRSHLPQQAARWVVAKMNEEFRASHPCFSLAGREHFELSNPPQNCGDTANPKPDPITLIRVFESRLQTNVPLAKGVACANSDAVGQKLFLTLEIGNHVSGGAGGMFHTVVTIDNRGNFIDYTRPDRDEKQTFVLPRTRTN
jgi:hypothetical protein